MPEPIRQPLDDIKFGAASLAERPALAVYIAAVTTAWAAIEVSLGYLLVIILQADAQTGIAIYVSLRGFAAQRNAILATSELYLSPDLLAECKELLNDIDNQAKARNKIVHALWGVTPTLPDALLSCHPGDYVRDATEVRYSDLPFASGTGFLTRVVAYRKCDFKEIIDKLGELKKKILDLCERIREWHELCEETSWLDTLSDADIRLILDKALRDADT